MAEAEKFYEVLDADGLVVTDDTGKEHHIRQGRVVPRSTFGGTITWLVDGHHVKEVDPPDSEQPPPSRAGRAVASAPPAPAPEPDEEGGSE
jgi:hypothetical protein